MSSRDWQLRVQDILNAIASVQKSTANMTFEKFLAEETSEALRDRIIHSLQNAIA